MNPRKFYIGFPPALAKTKRNGIEYGIGSIPLGGYVKIPGMHRPAAGDLDIHFGRAVEERPSLRRPVDELRRRLEESDYEGAREAAEHVAAALEGARLSPSAGRSAERGVNEVRTRWRRTRTGARRRGSGSPSSSPGPGANLVLAVVLFAVLFLSLERRLPARLRAARPTERGHRDGRRGARRHARRASRAARRATGSSRSTAAPVDAELDRDRRSAASDGRPLRVTVERGGRDGRSSCADARREPSEQPTAPVDSAWQAVRVTGIVTKEIGASVGRLVTGDGRDEISSPVGIVQGSSEAVEQGAEHYLWVLGLISLSLALLNLLPLLPLDGGHIAFSLIEGIRGKAVAREVYERVSAVGIAVVLLLFFIGLSNDIGRLD